eukprot:1147533-Pelagomonas_calceolata.AAC.11
MDGGCMALVTLKHGPGGGCGTAAAAAGVGNGRDAAGAAYGAVAAAAAAAAVGNCGDGARAAKGAAGSGAVLDCGCVAVAASAHPAACEVEGRLGAEPMSAVRGARLGMVVVEGEERCDDGAGLPE